MSRSSFLFLITDSVKTHSLEASFTKASQESKRSFKHSDSPSDSFPIFSNCHGADLQAPHADAFLFHETFPTFPEVKGHPVPWDLYGDLKTSIF